MSRRKPSLGAARFAEFLAVAALAVATVPQSVLAAPKPDLKVAGISTASPAVAAGSGLSVKDAVKNGGGVTSDPSASRFYLSSNRTKGEGDTRLNGNRRVERLRPGRTSRGLSALGVPLRTPPEELFLIACADDRKRIPEQRENNNCRAADRTVTVELPEDCTDRLTALGISFDAGPSQPGVADAVTIATPVNGITYSFIGSGNSSELYMDCTLALALYDMADEMTARGLTHVEHGGIYNYRCVGSGTPPDCPGGLSPHAYATAIDIFELRSATAETYSVNDDWVIDPEPTCAAPTSGAKDQVLHEFACALYTAGTFHILLTPNYNASMRDHFHFDLTPDISYIN